ncbi:MAG: exodeoxyribonuclease VII large subunit [Bacteroidales bacterium]
MPDKHLSLSQLSSIIKDIVNISLPQPIWVRGEISELRENRNGNCYLELVEKDPLSDKILAKFRAIIWERTFRMLKPYFEQSTQSELKAGINVLVMVKVEYNDIYGISLNIIDIDPTYTLGDMEMRRAMVIQQLTAEGVFEMNKELDFPLVPQRIAIISSKTAAGYEDFCNQLNQNRYGFKFNITLFEAFMQGDLAEKSIIEAMEKVPVQEFDVLVITRGGGSKSDLACFDGYDLANNVAQFPIPVISAIGHERDISVVDLVAHTRVKTPTAAAEFIIEKVVQYWQNMLSMYEQIIENTQYKLEQEFQFIEQSARIILGIGTVLNLKKQQLLHLTEKIQWSAKNSLKEQNQQLLTLNLHFKTLSKNAIQKQHKRLDNVVKDLAFYSKSVLRQFNQNIFHLEKVVDAYNPKHLLKKGYSITIKNGKVIKSIHDVKAGEEITTILNDGKLSSIINR